MPMPRWFIMHKNIAAISKIRWQHVHEVELKIRILITGSFEYIGSHTCVVSLDAGYDVAGMHNLSNSYKAVLQWKGQFTGRKPKFFEGDIRDSRFLQAVFADFQSKALTHLAVLKVVGESIEQSGIYYDNNIAGRHVPYEFLMRRVGDIVVSYADAPLTECTIAWKAQRGLKGMCKDALHWHSMNQNGYRK